MYLLICRILELFYQHGQLIVHLSTFILFGFTNTQPLRDSVTLLILFFFLNEK